MLIAPGMASVRAHAPGVLDLYVAAARREIDLAEARRALAPEGATQMRAALAVALATPA